MLRAQHNIRLITFASHASHLFQPLDLVTVAAFQYQKEEIYVDQPAGSQVWQITKLIKTLEHATDSTNNRAMFRRAGLIVNLRIFPPVALVDSAKLNGLIDAFTLSEACEADGGTVPSANGSRGQAIPIFGFLNADYFPHK
jgi:hypothetical protein